MNNKTQQDAFDRVSNMMTGSLVQPSSEYLEAFRLQLLRATVRVEEELARHYREEALRLEAEKL